MFYTVADLLLETARRTPNAPAVIDGDTPTSYQQLADHARHCAGFFSRRADHGDRVTLVLPRSAQTLAVFFGAHLAGLVPVYVHEQLGPRQVAHIIDHAQAVLAVTTTRHRPLLRDCSLTPDQILDPASITAPPRTTAPRRIGRDLAGLAYTSGSTGTLKGVMLSHDNLVAGAAIVADYLHLSSADRTLALLPWSFDYGLNQVLATFAAAGTVVIQRSAFPPDICRTLLAAPVTGMAAVPTVWAAMTSPHSPFLRDNYPHLRYLTNSGAALPTTVITAIRAAHPDIAIYSMYGLTEAFRSTFLDPSLIDTKPTSVGQPIPNSDILIIDDQGEPCPPGVTGQFIHRGPTVAMGYWRDPGATAAVFRPHPSAPPTGAAEIVVYSGDYGYADDDGDLHYLGRRDELFKSRGIRVTPTEIEQQIMASGLVDAVVAAPVTEGAVDPVILLAIQPRTGGFSLRSLEAYCQRELPAHMRPHHITMADQLPRTPHGKLDRSRIREQLTASVRMEPTP